MSSQRDLISRVWFPKVSSVLREFMMLVVAQDFKALGARFPLACTAEQFQEQFLDWMEDIGVSMPPEEAFSDFQFKSRTLEFTSNYETVPLGCKEHAIQILGDPINFFLCHMYFWDSRSNRTDLSLILGVTGPHEEEFKVIDVYMEVM